METKNDIIEKLDELRSNVKKAKTGDDLYNAFKKYQNTILEYWPEDLVNKHGMKREINFTLEKLEKSKDVKNISSSKDLSSFKQDAEEVMRHFNTEMEIYFKNTDVS